MSLFPTSDGLLPLAAARDVIAELKRANSELRQTIQAQQVALQQAAEHQRRHENYIQLLEEYPRLAKLRQYAAKRKNPGPRGVVR